MSEQNQGAQLPVVEVPSVLAVWKNNTWDITINDANGKNEINPRQRNLLTKLLLVHLKRRFRHFRIAAKKVAK
jgi:hypothetical protein